MQAGVFPSFSRSLQRSHFTMIAVSHERREHLEVDADPRLALGDLPGTERLALGAAEAGLLIDDDGPVLEFVVRGKGTERRTGGVVAVHAPSRNKDGLLLPADIHLRLLDENQVVGGQTVADLLLL